MKVLAIIDVATDAKLDQLRAQLPDELAGAWKMFEAGTLREAYATANPMRVVFVLETADVDRARAELGTLPLVASGAMHVELVELRPFANWAMLFAR